MSSVAGLRPQYVPGGFSLRDVRTDAGAVGFRDATDQVVLLYGQVRSEIIGLLVAIAPLQGDAKVLFGTENQIGTPVTVGTTKGVYHDGIWSTGPGFDQRDLEEGVTLHWEAGICHSVTATAGSLTVGVRSWHYAGLAREELVKTAASTLGTS